MSVDLELESWRNEWQTSAAIPADLRRRVRRQSRFVRIMLAADILVTVVVGGGATIWAARTPGTDYLVLALATWVFIAAAWAFVIRNRRGNWSPHALTTTAFLDVSIRRARSSIAAATFGTILYFAEIVFCLAWIYRQRLRSGPLPPGTFLTSPQTWIVWALTAAFAGFVVWYRRKKRTELSYLLNMRKSG